MYAVLRVSTVERFDCMCCFCKIIGGFTHIIVPYKTVVTIHLYYE